MNNQGSRFGERKPGAPNFEDVKLPCLNTTVEKVWEAIVLTEEIPPPINFGREPPFGSRSGTIDFMDTEPKIAEM